MEDNKSTIVRVLLKILIIALLLGIARYVYISKKQERLEKERRELYQEKMRLERKSLQKTTTNDSSIHWKSRSR